MTRRDTLAFCSLSTPLQEQVPSRTLANPCPCCSLNVITFNVFVLASLLWHFRKRIRLYLGGSSILNLRCRSDPHGIANCAKTPNELPQKHQTKHRKNTKQNATKIPNKMPQKYQTPCRIHKKPVSLQHHYIANNMEYLKRTADKHLSLLSQIGH